MPCAAYGLQLAFGCYTARLIYGLPSMAATLRAVAARR